MEKYFCIFGGGGIRGTAYTGAIKALEELNIEITGCAGSSIGAVVAGLYSFGYKTDEIKEIFNNINFQFFNDLNFNFGKDFAISKGENFYEWIKSKLEDKFYQNKNLENKQPIRFCDLDKELIIYSVNLINSKFHEFSKYKTPDVEIAHAIRVSVGMPGLYAPVINEDKNECLVDGDLLKAMPLWMASNTIKKKDEKILEFRLENNETNKKIANTIDYLNAVYDTISGFASDFIIEKYGKMEKYDYIKLNTEDISVVDFMADKTKKDKMTYNGYNTTLNYFKNIYPNKKEKIKNIYEWLNSNILKNKFLIEENNLKEAKCHIADILSSEKLKERIIESKIIDKLYDYKKIFSENYIIKNGFFIKKEMLIDKKSVISSVGELLLLIKDKM